MGNSNPEELTPQQRLFAHEYMIDQNATQAAIRAGYSERSAPQYAHELLKTPKVKELVDQLSSERLERLKVSSDDVLRELLFIAKSDLRKLFDENGALKQTYDWPDEIAASVSSLDIEDLFEGYGQDRTQIGYTKKIKLWDKTKALELLGRHLKLFTDKLEVEGDLSIAETMRKARERSKEK